MVRRCGTVFRPLTGQRRELVGPRHAVVAQRLERRLRPRRLRLVLYEQRQLDDGTEVVVAVDARLVKLAVEIVLETADDDVGVDGEDRDERGLGVRAATAAEQYVNLQQNLLSMPALLNTDKCFTLQA